MVSGALDEEDAVTTAASAPEAQAPDVRQTATGINAQP